MQILFERCRLNADARVKMTTTIRRPPRNWQAARDVTQIDASHQFDSHAAGLLTKWRRQLNAFRTSDRRSPGCASGCRYPCLIVSSLIAVAPARLRVVVTACGQETVLDSPVRGGSP
jgi:transposase-like protein